MRETVRFWRRRPLTAAAVVVLIGVAVAVATTAIAVAHAVLWRPLPFHEPDRVVTIRPVAAAGSATVWAQHYALWKERQDVFTDLAAYQFDPSAVHLALGHGVEEVIRLWITGNIFDLLGVRPAAGSLSGLHAGVSDQAALAVLSYPAWTRLFGRDASVIGRPLRVSYDHGPLTDITVAGVAPPGFEIQGFHADGIDLFTILPDGIPPEPRRHVDWRVIGRLLPGVTPEVAQGRMDDVVADAGQGAVPRPVGARVTRLHDDLYGDTDRFVRPLLATGVLIILIGCVSAGGTMLNVASHRARDVAIYLALGRPAGHVRRAFLFEGLGVGLLAGVVAWAGTRMLVSTVIALGSATSVPRLAETHVGGFEAGVAALLAAGCGLAIGAIPAYAADTKGLHALREGAAATISKGALRYRQGLLAAQLAFVLVLLVAAGLMLATLGTLVNRPLGFSMDAVLVAELRVPLEVGRDAGRGRLFLDRLMDAARMAPGRRAVAVAFDAPLDGGTGRSVANVYPTGPGGTSLRVGTERVEHGYFDVLGIPLIAGRDFLSGQDDASVIIVNEWFARNHFGSAAAAVGQTMWAGSLELPPAEIVGVVGDTRHAGLKHPMGPMMYRPLVQSFTQPLPMIVRLIAREHDDQVQGAAGLRTAIQGVDPRLHVRVAPLADRFRRDIAEERLLAMSLAVLAGSALLLAVLGIVALVGQLVTARQRELAIRLVLGSSPGAIQRLMIRAVAMPGAAGVVAGLVLAWWAVGLIDHFLFEIPPFDPAVWGIAVGGVMAATLVSAWWPARRAPHVDPAQVLRSE